MKTYAQIVATLEPWTSALQGAAQREGWNLFIWPGEGCTVQVVSTFLGNDEAAMLVLAYGRKEHHRVALQILLEDYLGEWCNVLAALIRDVAACVNSVGPDGIAAAVQPLRAWATPNCQIGRGAEMNNTDPGYALQLEWFAGQLLNLVDTQVWHGVNTWLNCVDKFTTRLK